MERRVLVTGAASGIGRAIAWELAAAGASLVLNDCDWSSSRGSRRRRATEAHLRRLDCDFQIVESDVSQEADVKEMYNSLFSHNDRLDILVNSAGEQRECPSHLDTPTSFSQILNTNLLGPFQCIRLAVANFLNTGTAGVVLNIGSVHESIPKPGFASYAASKAALRMLTATLALEYAEHGIRFNSIAPGVVDTDMNRTWNRDSDKREAVRSRIPLQRIGTVHDVVSLAMFLVSPESSYITGQSFYVDGGLSLYPEFAQNWTS